MTGWGRGLWTRKRVRREWACPALRTISNPALGPMVPQVQACGPASRGRRRGRAMPGDSLSLWELVEEHVPLRSGPK